MFITKKRPQISAMNNFEDAKENCIIRPQKAKIGHKFDRWVTSESNQWQRRCFVQLRRYLSIECGFRMSMNLSEQCWEGLEIFSLTDKFEDKKRDEIRQWLIGCVAFHRQHDRKTRLEYCWIHPFWRNRKLLKKNWPEFIERYGLFFVRYPRSNAMENFLKTINYIEPEYGLIDEST